MASQRQQLQVVNNYNYTNNCYGYDKLQPRCFKMTRSQFMSQPLAAFINDDEGQTNYQISKSIVDFYQDRDDGYYAAITSDKPIKWSGYHTDAKYKYIKKCRGKYIIVYKQAKSEMLLKRCKQSTVKACAIGLIMENMNNLTEVSTGLSELFGDYWSVCCGGKVYSHYDGFYFVLNIKNKTYIIWRQPR